MTGKLIGIGVGPGDPELLTLKAHRLLTNARIVAYPAPDSGESFARSIVAEFMPEGAVEIPIIVPMRVERFPAKAVYDKAAETIGEHLRSGEDVVVLCEGDPFFYGSYMYLYERLAGEFTCEVVPGVSSLVNADVASVNSEGLIIARLPATKICISGLKVSCTGKFHGLRMPTTPFGS